MPSKINRRPRVDRLLVQLIKDNTPKTDNRCSREGCNGTVVRRPIVPQSRKGHTEYESPACDTCNKVHLYATKARKLAPKEGSGQPSA